MIPEINSAVSFLSSILHTGNNSTNLSPDQMMRFQRSLEAALAMRFRDHWFPDRPMRGSGYRCVRIVNRKLDRLLVGAAAEAGVPEPILQRLLPSELTLWIDPEDVSYRIGEDGSVGIIYDGRSTGDSNDNVSLSLSTDVSSHQMSSSSGIRFSPDTVNYEYLNAISEQQVV